MSEIHAPLFRGATKPAMLFGIPLAPLILMVTPFLLLTVILWTSKGLVALLCLIPAVLLVFVMRDMSKKDEHFLLMFLLDMQERHVWLGFRRNALRRMTIIPPRPLRGTRFIQD